MEYKVCTKCGEEKSVDMFRHQHNACRECEAAYDRGLRRIRVSEGKCIRCTDNALDNSSLCLYHYFQYSMAHTMPHDDVKAATLMGIWEAQDKRCAYTGEILVPGVNLSFDHIKPVSRYPELAADYSNIQLVTKDVNRIKGALNDVEFIELCNLISSRAKDKTQTKES